MSRKFAAWALITFFMTLLAMVVLAVVSHAELSIIVGPDGRLNYLQDNGPGMASIVLPREGHGPAYVYTPPPPPTRYETPDYVPQPAYVPPTYSIPPVYAVPGYQNFSSPPPTFGGF